VAGRDNASHEGPSCHTKYSLPGGLAKPIVLDPSVSRTLHVDLTVEAVAGFDHRVGSGDRPRRENHPDPIIDFVP